MENEYKYLINFIKNRIKICYFINLLQLILNGIYLLLFTGQTNVINIKIL